MQIPTPGIQSCTQNSDACNLLEYDTANKMAAHGRQHPSNNKSVPKIILRGTSRQVQCELRSNFTTILGKYPTLRLEGSLSMRVKAQILGKDQRCQRISHEKVKLCANDCCGCLCTSSRLSGVRMTESASERKAASNGPQSASQGAK